MSNWRKEIEARLEDFKLYEKNWDWEGAIKPIEDCIDAAKKELVFFETIDKLPHLCPTKEGGISFDWDEKWGYLTVDFLPEDKILILFTEWPLFPNKDKINEIAFEIIRSRGRFLLVAAVSCWNEAMRKRVLI